MHLEQSLTKDNFFNEMMEKYPEQMQHFCDWIDKYKKACGWENLFKPSIKFHDLPHAMQMGIWITYVRDCQAGSGYDWPVGDITTYELVGDIDCFFSCAVETQAEKEKED